MSCFIVYCIVMSESVCLFLCVCLSIRYWTYLRNYTSNVGSVAQW